MASKKLMRKEDALHEREERLHAKAERSEKADSKIHKKIAKIHRKEEKEDKVSKVMREFKRGKLHEGSKKGPVVTNPKQAIAIGLSEARRKKKK